MHDINLLHFKRMRREHLPLMHRWLNHGLANKWYGKKQYTMEEIENKYLSYINKEVPTEGFIIHYDTTPIGYIQTYMIHDHPDYANIVQIEEKAAGLDLFIGEDTFIHKGLGSQIITQFLQEKVFDDQDTESCILGPEPDNRAAIRTYEKVGFQYIKTVNTEDGPEYIMEIGREKLDK